MIYKKTSKLFLSTKFVSWIIIIFLLCQLILLIPPTESAYKKTFSDGKFEKTITFTTSGIDDSVNISIAQGTSIKFAQVNITPDTSSNEYLSDLFLDVGNDNDYEWAFSGQGYGALGHQTVFYDSTSEIKKNFQSSSDTISSEIRILKNATIKNAKLNISGELLEYTSINTIDSTLGTTYNSALGDIDNDNDLDVVVTHYLGSTNYPTLWFENTAGDGSSWTSHTIGTGMVQPFGLGLGDLDGDNDIDVIVADNMWNSRDILWFNNTNGLGTAWTQHTIQSSIPGTSSRVYCLVVADMNNDSFNDVVVALYNTDNTQEDFYWLSNDFGNGSSWTKNIINITANGARNIYVTDIDGDGDNDTAAVAAQFSGADQVVWYSNDDGNGTTWTQYLINTTLADPFSLVVKDIDGDFNPDLAVIGTSNTVWFEAPDNPTLVSNWKLHDIGTGTGGWNGGDIAIADIGFNFTNRQPDNNLDVIVACSGTNDVIIYKNDGTPLDGGWIEIDLNLDHTTALSVDVGDIDGDLYNDTLVGSYAWTTNFDLVWYKLGGGVPSNVELFLGADATADWVEPQQFDYSVQIPDFTTNLTQYITQAISNKDEYGTEFVSIPLTVSSATAGIITLSNLEIKYDFTATVDKNSHGNLATELTEALTKIQPDSKGNCTVPFKFISGSSGSIRVHDLILEYNEFPWFIQKLPEILTLPEDSSSNALLDFSKYLADDYLSPTQLQYNISYISGPGLGKVELSLYNDYYLSADAFNGTANDDWTGHIDFRIEITDDHDSTIESDIIRVIVTPVNDEPILGPEKYPELLLVEGGTSKPLDLDEHDYFVDVDLDPLYFMVKIDPENKINDENLTFELDSNTNSVTITAHDDWYGSKVPVRVYCDDSKPVNDTLYQDFIVTVLNLNDRPIWDTIPDLIIDEDEVRLKAVNLQNYVTDPDDVLENITFSLISNSNSEAINVIINEQNFVDVYPNIPEYSGSTIATVRASDPGLNYSDTSFKITYQPVNDPPEVKLISPKHNSVVASDQVILTWEAKDIDTPLANLTYNVFLSESMPPEQFPGAENLIENTFTIQDLWNQMTYYCRILANDGDQASVSEVVMFTVDLSAQPRIQLISPKPNIITPKTNIAFDWEVVESGDKELTFDFYLAKTVNLTDAGPNLTGLTESEIEISDLETGNTYYWTVIPRFDTGYGVCENGVLKFTIDQSKIEFGLDIKPLEPEIKVYQGKEYVFEVEFVNLGANDEVIKVYISPKNISNNIEMLHGEVIAIGAESSKIIEFSLDTTNIIHGKYTITITAESRTTPAMDKEDISLVVRKVKPKSDRDQIFKSYLDILPIIVLIIVLVIGIALIMRYKPKGESEYSDEEVDKLLGAPDQDISYKPSLESVARPTWQLQTPGGDQVPTMGPYTTDEGLPQLPPSIPRYEPTTASVESTPELSEYEPIPTTEEPDVEVYLPEDITSEAPSDLELPEIPITKDELDEVKPQLEELEPLEPEMEEPGAERLGMLPEELEELEKSAEPKDPSSAPTPDKIKPKKEDN